ncbi:MAG: hypothetical protein HY827_07090 [Actinobacteria bacterium]|nr:hypothetical protein [Actinomycetota bacterium]
MLSVRSTQFRASRQLIAAFITTIALAAALALAMAPASLAKSKPAGGPPKVCAIIATPPISARLINTTQSILLTVYTESPSGRRGKKCDKPLTGQSIDVRVLTGPNAGLVTALTTDGAGQATFMSTSAVPGIEVTKYTAGGRVAVSHTFWVTKHGGPGPYGEHHGGIRVLSNNSNTGVVYVAKRCYTHGFRLFPAFDGDSFVSSTFSLDGREVATSTAADASYAVSLRGIKPGSRHRISILAKFTSGGPVELKASFTRCGH